MSTARAVRAILFIQSVETLCAVIQGGGTAIVRHRHRLHVLIDDEENTKSYCSMGVFTFNKLYSWMHSACFPCQKKKR